jgi:uncharacterized membrane protein
VGAFLFGPVHGFMLFNAFLAAIPAVIAVGLFATAAHRGVARRSVVWWIGLGAWVLFLPNAPYLLTDVVHMIHDIQASRSDAWAYLVVVTYSALFAFGLASYALSLQLFRRYLHRNIRSVFVAPTILFLHALCVVGIYLGRVLRLNSTDAVLAPHRVVASLLHIPQPFTLAVLAMMFLVVGVGVFAAAAIGDKVVAQARRVL